MLFTCPKFGRIIAQLRDYPWLNWNQSLLLRYRCSWFSTRQRIIEYKQDHHYAWVAKRDLNNGCSCTVMVLSRDPNLHLLGKTFLGEKTRTRITFLNQWSQQWHSSIGRNFKTAVYEDSRINFLTSFYNSTFLFEQRKTVHEVCLSKLYSFSVGKFMHSYHNKLLPNHFDENFIPLSSIHYHSTRLATSRNLFLPRVNSSSGKCSLKFIGPNVWSSIPDDIKFSTTFTFKWKLKKHLLYEKIPNYEL